MEEQYKAFDKNSDSVFDYLEFQQIAAHFTIEQTKTMAGASQLLLTDGRRDFMKETNKRKLRKMFDRFDLDGSGGLDKKEIISILNELRESRGKPLDKTTIISLFEEYDADGSGGLDFDEFLDLATDLFLLEEHRQSVELSSPFAAPAASVPPAKKDKEKMVLYFGRSEDFPMVDFSGLGKIVPDGVIDGMSIIDEDHLVGGAPFGLNCTGMSYRLEMARMLFVKCFARVDKIQNRISDDHLFDWGSKSFADGKDDSKEVDFDQVFDCSDVVVDEKAMERYEKLQRVRQNQKVAPGAEVAFADAGRRRTTSRRRRTSRPRTKRAELDKFSRSRTPRTRSTPAPDPWVLRYATLDHADQAASFRSGSWTKRGRKPRASAWSSTSPSGTRRSCRWWRCRERPRGRPRRSQLVHRQDRRGRSGEGPGGVREVLGGTGGHQPHNLRKGAWHESNFRTIVETPWPSRRGEAAAAAVRQQVHAPAGGPPARLQRRGLRPPAHDIEDIAVDAFGWQAVPTADDASTSTTSTRGRRASPSTASSATLPTGVRGGTCSSKSSARATTGRWRCRTRGRSASGAMGASGAYVGHT